MEAGAPDRWDLREGWLGRHLRTMASEEPGLFRAVALGGATPLSLAGPERVLAIPGLQATRIANGFNSEILTPAIEELYLGQGGALGGAARDALEAVEAAEALRDVPSPVEYPAGKLAEQLRDVATMIRADVGLEIAFLSVGGWDTHDHQASRLTAELGTLAVALAAFRAHLDDRFDEVCLLTMSEFGRTVAENGSLGTDHGHATAMLVLGGAVAGGRVYGEWPGLSEDALHEGRDLAVTTDFRTLFAEIVQSYLGNPEIATIFPGFAYDETARLGVIRG
jgi:uncharacterized protein (DUF1501 family)